ncbi:hypothetical protein [Bradyrhizobium tropiciagri]|uniref:hypothetical protein n=1 Tax=Bradyrhizobium tropiciagri TaxID=312253 RepID=UPI000B2C28BB|nr:hypothetical protein [Bradyrhizobium tropiciagri]
MDGDRSKRDLKVTNVAMQERALWSAPAETSDIGRIRKASSENPNVLLEKHHGRIIFSHLSSNQHAKSA